MLLLDALRAHAESRTDHPALVWPELRLTYGELDERIRQATTVLRRRGVRAGDRVALAMDRTPAAVILHLAALAAGATSVPLAPDAGSSVLGTVAEVLQPVCWYGPAALVDGVSKALPQQPHPPGPPLPSPPLPPGEGGRERQTLQQGTGGGAPLPVEGGAMGEGTGVRSSSGGLRDTLLEGRITPPVCWLEPGEALWQEICAQAPDAAPPPVDPDAVALILCTSGTAGEPKCVKLTHRATAAAAGQINRFTGLTATDREILTLPLHHSFGLGRLRCLLVAGATGFIQPGVFRAERLLSAIRREQATVFAQVPAGIRLLLAYGERARSYAASIRLIEIGSAALTVAEREQVLALFPQARICHHFGLTEASRSIFCEYRDLADRGKLDSLGRPAPGVEVALDEPRQAGDRVEGLLKVRGPHVCAGYANSSLAGEHATADGWWQTGDRVQIDREGFLYAVGRQSDLINLGGYKVAPEEIESQLVRIAGVRDAAVVGCPDPAVSAVSAVSAAMVLVAFIEPEDPLHPPAAADLQRHLYGVLESYKVPSHFRFVAALARTENGKIRRAALLQELGAP